MFPSVSVVSVSVLSWRNVGVSGLLWGQCSAQPAWLTHKRGQSLSHSSLISFSHLSYFESVWVSWSQWPPLRPAQPTHPGWLIGEARLTLRPTEWFSILERPKERFWVTPLSLHIFLFSYIHNVNILIFWAISRQGSCVWMFFDWALWWVTRDDDDIGSIGLENCLCFLPNKY